MSSFDTTDLEPSGIRNWNCYTELSQLSVELFSTPGWRVDRMRGTYALITAPRVIIWPPRTLTVPYGNTRISESGKLYIHYICIL